MHVIHVMAARSICLHVLYHAHNKDFQLPELGMMSKVSGDFP